MSPGAYRTYLVAALAFIFAFHCMDGLALGLVLQDIKTELKVSDTQLGLLTGFAFFFFYAVLGVPLARWADRGNRIAILAITTALGGLAVVMCGLAGSFVQLLLIRILLAVGDAGCRPVAMSLIADYFSRAERPRAVAYFQLGAPLSIFVGYFLAGWLNQFFGWRMTFVLLGIPGLLFAALAWWTLKEPRRHESPEPRAGTDGPETTPAGSPSFRAVISTLWANRTFRMLLLSFAVISFFTSGIAMWKSAFFIRSFGLKTGELGTWFTLIYGLGSLIGIYLGGELASRVAARNERLQLKAMALVYCFLGIVGPLTYLATDFHVAMAWIAVATLGSAATLGPVFAIIQTLVPERMRATSMAFIALCSSLVGNGLGPLAAGALSDWYQSWAGSEALRYALLTLCPGYFLSAWFKWRASLTVVSDLEAAERTLAETSLGAASIKHTTAVPSNG